MKVPLVIFILEVANSSTKLAKTQLMFRGSMLTHSDFLLLQIAYTWFEKYWKSSIANDLHELYNLHWLEKDSHSTCVDFYLFSIELLRLWHIINVIERECSAFPKAFFQEMKDKYVCLIIIILIVD